jgi:Ca2+-binding EF-hand superfamily protein
LNGYLGHKECASYVNGVTMTYCPTNDSRVCDLFSRYDLDKDEKISLEDFLRFYKECIEDPGKL